MLSNLRHAGRMRLHAPSNLVLSDPPELSQLYLFFKFSYATFFALTISLYLFFKFSYATFFIELKHFILFLQLC